MSLLGQPFLENVDEIIIRKGEMLLRKQEVIEGPLRPRLPLARTNLVIGCSKYRVDRCASPKVSANSSGRFRYFSSRSPLPSQVADRTP